MSSIMHSHRTFMGIPRFPFSLSRCCFQQAPDSSVKAVPPEAALHLKQWPPKSMGGFPQMGVPQNLCSVGEKIPFKMGDLEVPPILGHLHMFMAFLCFWSDFTITLVVVLPEHWGHRLWTRWLSPTWPGGFFDWLCWMIFFLSLTVYICPHVFKFHLAGENFTCSKLFFIQRKMFNHGNIVTQKTHVPMFSHGFAIVFPMVFPTSCHYFAMVFPMCWLFPMGTPLGTKVCAMRPGGKPMERVRMLSRLRVKFYMILKIFHNI